MGVLRIERKDMCGTLICFYILFGKGVKKEKQTLLFFYLTADHFVIDRLQTLREWII